MSEFSDLSQKGNFIDVPAMCIAQVVVNQGDDTRPNAFLNSPFISVNICLTSYEQTLNLIN